MQPDLIRDSLLITVIDYEDLVSLHGHPSKLDTVVHHAVAAIAGLHSI